MKNMKRMGLALLGLGLIFATGPYFWGVDVGGTVLSKEEAWNLGVAQPTVIFGALLILLAVFLYRGALWARWPVVLWCPLSIFASIVWDAYCGVATVIPLEFVVEGIPVILFWVWVTWNALFKQIKMQQNP